MRGCGYQASVTAGALLHKTRTGLRKWLLAVWLLASMKKRALGGRACPPASSSLGLPESVWCRLE